VTAHIPGAAPILPHVRLVPLLSAVPKNET